MGGVGWGQEARVPGDPPGAIFIHSADTDGCSLHTGQDFSPENTAVTRTDEVSGSEASFLLGGQR